MYATPPSNHTLPPEGLDLFSPRVLADPVPYYRVLQDYGPAVRTAHPGDPLGGSCDDALARTSSGVWAVPRFTDVCDVLERQEFGERGGPLTDSTVCAAAAELARGQQLATRHRRLLAGHLGPAAMSTQGSWLGDTTRDAVREHLAAGGEFDGAALARQIAADTVSGLVGLPRDESRHELATAAPALLDQLVDATPAPSADRLRGILRAHCARPAPAGSLLGALQAATRRGGLRAQDIPPLVIHTSTTASVALTASLTTTLHLLAAHPAQQDRLRDRPGAPPARTVLRRAWHEAARYDPPVTGLSVHAQRDTHVGGVRLARRDQVWLLLGSAGRDPAAWGHDVDSFRADRLTGSHPCLAAVDLVRHLAEHVSVTALDALLRAASLTPAGDGTRTDHALSRGWRTLPLTSTPRQKGN